jgi:hypothetical protein
MRDTLYRVNLSLQHLRLKSSHSFRLDELVATEITLEQSPSMGA